MKIKLVAITILLVGLLSGLVFATTIASANPCEVQVASASAGNDAYASNYKDEEDNVNFVENCIGVGIGQSGVSQSAAFGGVFGDTNATSSVDNNAEVDATIVDVD
jgi:hypothetical protein